MKRFLTFLFIILTTTVYGQLIKKARVYRPISRFYVDLNNDGKVDTISISSSLEEKECFNRISIKLAGYKKQTFIAKEYWSNFDKWFLDSNKNIVNSKFVFIKKTEKHAVILLWGNTDGAGFGIECSIINIENNHIKMVFDHDDDVIDVENPIKLTDLKNDGRLCFIYNGIGEFDEILKKGKVGVYLPYYVYPVDDSCRLNKPLTKAYNEKYYVFAGYKYDERLRVYYPNDGSKPIILKRRRTEP